MTRPVSRIGRRHSEQRLAAIFDQIMQGGPADDDPRDYEAMAEARRDPEADLERAEEMYEKEMGL